MQPSRLYDPTIFYTKKMLSVFKEERDIQLFWDIHGHSRKKNAFMYGCESNTFEYDSRAKNACIRLFPALMAQKNSCFNFKDWSFKWEKSKEETARIVCFKEIDIRHSFTLESTFYGRDRTEDDAPDKDMHMNIKDFEVVGEDLAKTMINFIPQLRYQRKIDFLYRKFLKIIHDEALKRWLAYNPDRYLKHHYQKDTSPSKGKSTIGFGWQIDLDMTIDITSEPLGPSLQELEGPAVKHESFDDNEYSDDDSFDLSMSPKKRETKKQSSEIGKNIYLGDKEDTFNLQEQPSQSFNQTDFAEEDFTEFNQVLNWVEEFENINGIQEGEKSNVDDSDSGDSEDNLIWEKLTKFSTQNIHHKDLKPKNIKITSKVKTSKSLKKSPKKLIPWVKDKRNENNSGKPTTLRMKKTSSIVKNKSEKLKSAIKGTMKKQNRQLHKKIHSKKFTSGLVKYEHTWEDAGLPDSAEEYNIEIQNLDNLKRMLWEVAKNRFSGNNQTPESEEFISELADKNNCDMLIKYLTGNGNFNMPTSFKNRLGSSLESIQKHKDSVEQMNDDSEEEKQERLSYCPTNEVQDGKSPSKSWMEHINITPTDFDKPLLNSKQNISKLLILERNASNGKYDQFKHELNSGEYRNVEDTLNATDNILEYRNHYSPDSKAQIDPPRPIKHIRLQKKIRKDSKARETDPILAKNKPFVNDKKSFREFHRVRESKKSRKKKQTLQVHRHVSYTDKMPEELFDNKKSPMHMLLEKSIYPTDVLYNSKQFNLMSIENYLQEAPIADSDFASNLVLDGSTSEKWRFLRKDFNIPNKWLFYRENNYSNSSFIHESRKQRNKVTPNSIDQIVKERMLNHSTDIGAVAGHEFFANSRVEDNINEDVHSFIYKHRQEQKNVKDSYLYEESIGKTSTRRLAKSGSKHKNLNNPIGGEYSKPNDSFISVNGSRYESQEKNSSPLKNHRLMLESLKLNKARSSEIKGTGRSYQHKQMNRENPYKMSFSFHRR